jgi:hypothetical protein
MNVQHTDSSVGMPFRLRKMVVRTVEAAEQPGIMHAGTHSCTGTPCSQATAPTWCNQTPTCSPSATSCDGVTCGCC